MFPEERLDLAHEPGDW